MEKNIDIAILLEDNQAYCDWPAIKSAVEAQVQCQFNEVSTTQERLEESLASVFSQNNIVLVDTPFRTLVGEHISHQTVQSHFMHYCDYLEKKNGKWWAGSTFSDFFHPVMLDVLRKNPFKGPAIFLGLSPICVPVLEVLTRVGVSEVAFLKVDNDSFSMHKKFHDSLNSFFGVQFAEVDSTAFIQSEKEYAFCFVARENYRAQVLDDMSYFHFLSQRSTVFDLCGKSNFLFDEVKALGVPIIEEKSFRERQLNAYLQKIQQFDAAN